MSLNNNSITHVCYDGVGARKGGTHTKKIIFRHNE